MEIRNSKFELLKAKLNGLSDYAPHLIKYSLFTVSSIFTILLFQSQGATPFSKVLQSVLGLIIELAKYTLPVIAIVGVIAGKQVHMGLRVIAFIMAIACFYYSIMATQGYQLIELKQIETDTIQSSDEYKRLQSELLSKKEQLKSAMQNTSKLIELDKQSKNNNSTLINTLNADIKKDKKELETKNNDVLKSANKGNWGEYNKLNTEIKQLQTSIDKNYKQLENIKSSDVLGANDSNIDKLNADITVINTKIDSLYNGKKVKSGYDILFSNQAEFNNFIMWLAVLIEFVGIYFAVIVGLNSTRRVKKITTVYYDNDSEQQEKKEAKIGQDYSTQQINYKPGQDLVTARTQDYNNNTGLDVGYHNFKEYDKPDDSIVNSKKIQGFVYDPPKNEVSVPVLGGKFFAHEDNLLNNNSTIPNTLIEKYKVCMYKTCTKSGNDVMSRGYGYIADKIDIDKETARKIKGHLEQTGIVKTKGNKTYILQ
jgi:hypothetical protein